LPDFKIAQREVQGRGACDLERRFAVRRGTRLNAAPGQCTLQGAQKKRVIVDEQTDHARTPAGSRKLTHTPGPSVGECIDSMPPSLSTVACDSASPMPSPPGLLVRNRVPGSSGEVS